MLLLKIHNGIEISKKMWYNNKGNLYPFYYILFTRKFQLFFGLFLYFL